MSRTEFNRRTELEEYQTFMEKLKAQKRIKFVSNRNLISLVPFTHTAVCITMDENKITVFVETGKPDSLKTVAA